MSSIEDAIAAAKQAATVTQLPASTIADAAPPLHAAPPGATAVATAPGAVAPVTMDQLMKSTIQADYWLKVNEFGITLGKSDDLVQRVLVDIDMVDVRPGFGYRAGANPPKYWKTYDKVYANNGEPWSECLRQARIIDPGVREYPLVDFVGTLVEDVKGSSGRLAQAGETVAHTTSVTNWKNFNNFYRTLQKLSLHDQIVRVILSKEKRTGNGNTWGVIKFDYVPD